MFWITLELAGFKMGLITSLFLRVEKLNDVKYDGVDKSCNTVLYFAAYGFFPTFLG